MPPGVEHNVFGERQTPDKFVDSSMMPPGVSSRRRVLALAYVLVRKGLLTNEEVLEEIKAVRREMEGKRGR